MAQTGELTFPNVAQPEILLLAVSEDGSVKVGLPPRHYNDNYSARAVDVAKLGNVSHVLCSPEGELYCVRRSLQGEDLYRGPLPSNTDVDWYSIARRVGKSEWDKFKHLFFHPNGELYGITNDGNFYKGPQPSNENVPWMYGQATQIGMLRNLPIKGLRDPVGWLHCNAAFFHPSGVLYAVIDTDKIVKGNPPTTLQTYNEWLETTTVAGGSGWSVITHFMAFSPEGDLWAVDRENGEIYSGSITEDGRYIEHAKKLGIGYNQFCFLCLTKDKTISDIISFEFLPERGEKVSESPEEIEQKIYNNRSSSVLKHKFTFDKIVKTSSSFSHEHGFTFEVGAKLKFKAGIPCIAETEASVHMNLSTTNTWSFTETNETEEKFSSSSDVEVPPGKAIRVVASVMKAEISVPYRARVRTVYGSETDIEGTWTGATVYNMMVTQEDYKYGGLTRGVFLCIFA